VLPCERQVPAAGTKVFLACRPVDLRNGFDGLAAKAQQVISADPFSGHLFIFRGKRGDYFKGLYWDGSGMWLIAKRLEKGRFVWPPIVDGACTCPDCGKGMARLGEDVTEVLDYVPGHFQVIRHIIRSANSVPTDLGLA
jgi:transposase